MPYVPAKDRGEVIAGQKKLLKPPIGVSADSHLYHVDFLPEEVRYLQGLMRSVLRLPTAGGASNPQDDLTMLLRTYPKRFKDITGKVDQACLRSRSSEDVRNFLADLSAGALSTNTNVLTLSKDKFDKRGAAVRASRIPALLFARELGGLRGVSSAARHIDVHDEVRKALEDRLELRVEFTDCAGDISTVVWCSDDAFICGTTTHSDTRNQQYNKPGNLLLGSSKHGTLRAHPEHRIVRPIVQSGENATAAMVQSQDPWLYTSVVSSDYDPINDLAFTWSFAKTASI